MKMPGTWFSTRLSGSDKETGLRIRNIVQWKKKRPPLTVILLTIVMLLLCFGLFSCQPQNDLTDAPPVENTPVEDVLPQGTEEPEVAQSDFWIYEPETDPRLTVQNAVFGQNEKDYTIQVSFNAVPGLVEDAQETQRMQERLLGSELAQSRGWSDEQLQNHFVAVWARYDAEYDHTKTHLADGRITQYFYLIQNPDTGLWFIVDNSAGVAEEILAPDSEEYRNQLIREFYEEEHACHAVYMPGEKSDEPKPSDLFIESITVLGETPVYEVTGVLLNVQGQLHGSYGLHEYNGHLVLTKGLDNSYDQVIGTAFVSDGLTEKEVILKEIWNLSDLEVSLFRDGYPSPVGPGTDISFYRDVYDGPETVEVQEGWEPIYYEGDYWAIHRWSGVEALCYHSKAEERYAVNTFETTRTDLRTYRGIRVGDSRQAVQAAYPELKSGNYWGKYPGEDYLWYCTSEQDLGAALIFFFEHDVVSRIVLTNMFN